MFWSSVGLDVDRSVILYLDSSNKSSREIHSVVKSNENHKTTYSEVVRHLFSFDKKLMSSVREIYIESVSGDSIESHYSFCRDVANHYDIICSFIVKNFKICISKNTPDDWYDICIDDCYADAAKKPDEFLTFGPDYVEISDEDLKERAWSCRQLIDYTESLITIEITTVDDKRDEYVWRSHFKKYDDFYKWSLFRYGLIFKYTRRLTHYVKLMTERGLSLSKEDIERYMEFDADYIKNMEDELRLSLTHD